MDSNDNMSIISVVYMETACAFLCECGLCC